MTEIFGYTVNNVDAEGIVRNFSIQKDGAKYILELETIHRGEKPIKTVVVLAEPGVQVLRHLILNLPNLRQYPVQTTAALHAEVLKPVPSAWQSREFCTATETWGPWYEVCGQRLTFLKYCVANGMTTIQVRALYTEDCCTPAQASPCEASPSV